MASYDDTTFVNSSEHLTCFDGGNFLLGGSVLGRQDYIDFGLALVNGCHDLYNSTVTGIGPETFSWNTTGVDPADEAFYNANGFYITSSVYDLRPEVIESFYYAYRITGKASIADVVVVVGGKAARLTGLKATRCTRIGRGKPL